MCVCLIKKLLKENPPQEQIHGRESLSSFHQGYSPLSPTGRTGYSLKTQQTDTVKFKLMPEEIQ